MRDLNPKKMRFFYACNVASAKEATDDEYFTVHVTPEPEFSYASFETNIALPCYLQLVKRVLEMFEPQTFICTLVTEIVSFAFFHRF
ncbi:unnamed protein product [Schistocephalus solidus]|uniref:S-adenosylmethionine decarboxylase proenzyme n=1 Tax=Schistocephalus solidus TaxID=70667 RepID=A0A183SHB3_SCHSO|nr:unnamed protein product [Schistocephalus solidus]